MYQALIFDLDGTLWDTAAPCALAWTEALRVCQIERAPITPADIGSIMGLQHHEIFARLFPSLETCERERLSSECYHQEEVFIRRYGGRLYPGVAETLAELHRHYPLAIVSNCQVGYIEMFFELTGLGHLFADFESHGRTGLSKAENLAAVLQRNNWSRAAYVGDTQGDQQAASRCEIPFLYAAYGFGSLPVQPRLERLEDLWLHLSQGREATPAAGSDVHAASSDRPK